MKRPDKVMIAVIGIASALLTACGTAASGAESVAAAQTTPTVMAQQVANPVLVDAVTARGLIEQGAVLVDVRTPEEFADAHIDGALLIDVSAGDFEARLAELDPSRAHVVYCRTGNRSAAAAAVMTRMGFSEIYDLGGLSEWTDAGLPTQSG
jgi:phage shock protein E